MTTVLTITGMRSVHCARAVYTALGTVSGVTTASVVIGEAVVEHDGRAGADELTAAVAMVGYTVVAVKDRGRALPLL